MYADNGLALKAALHCEAEVTQMSLRQAVASGVLPARAVKCIHACFDQV